MDLREKQIEAFGKMLRLSRDANSKDKSSVDEEDFKVLVLDSHTRDLVAPLLKVNDLRRHGVTLHLMLEVERQPIADVPAVYFLQPTEAHVKRVAKDAAAGLYEVIHLHFASPVPRPMLELLAAEAVQNDCVGRIAKVSDQYLDFLTLEKGMFSLAQPRAYVQLNDPAAKDTDVEAAVGAIVSGLFNVLVTMGVVPYIRAPRGGAAEMVASELDKRLRDHLTARNNLFTETSSSSSFQRPLLCVFDRNFELAVAMQHVWTYQPLVHDNLGLSLNRVTVHLDHAPGTPMNKKTYDLEQSDPFWVANANAAFPKVAEEAEGGLQKYKADVAEVNRKTDIGGDDETDGLLGSTQNLVSAVNSLPELTERKRVIDKHTNILHSLLASIKTRALDVFYQVEEEMMTSGCDKNQLMSILNDQSKGNAMDKTRLAMVYLIACEALPPQADLDAIEEALKMAGGDPASFTYVKRMRSLNLASQGAVGGGAGAGASSQSNLVDWADKLYNQGVSAVTKGVKNLLSTGRQLAVARAIEALMEAKPGPETDGYALFDPKASKASSTSGPASGDASAKGRAPIKDGIVFMIGGGNYLEYHSLMDMAVRNPVAPKSIVYGSTDVLSANSFVEQLAELGRKMTAK